MKKLLLLFLVLLAFKAESQELKPGFDQFEYLQLLRAYARWGDSTVYDKIPESRIYKKIGRKYRSEEIGFQNSWEMYETPTQTVISIRGSTKEAISWMANFYAAMIPAVGSMKLNDSLTVDYHFADHPEAAVHVGWAVAACYLIPDILEKVKDRYSKKRNNFIIFGHSQGAGIAYFVTAQLRYYQRTGVLPKDIKFKTYCSAAPKPGNLYFAYDYEESTQFGWSTSVVNAADWVPEVPFTVQTLKDFNKTNPFKLAPKMIEEAPFPNNIVMSYLHKQLTKHNRKALKKYKLFLGTIASKMVASKLPKGFEAPKKFYESTNYVRCGNFIILKPDDEYYKKFPDNDSTLFVHHGILPYTYLTERLKLN
ncbi:lipase family protein [Flavobacterium sp. MAH-1]|uniref:Lipase family protein n=1 Tax=Flavobacterium agri TaxID=2743471 RepID=A0A7Y8Y4Q1_9FLAO|nr:lipase family protein [Flavobacterium agri]NUY82479.1 lipase family protein [Flavobacterium agri]NYA72503.1 lipase family protein [Flavobacterium agri]